MGKGSFDNISGIIRLLLFCLAAALIIVPGAFGDIPVEGIDFENPSFYPESPNAPAHEIEPQPDQAAEPAPGTDQTVTPLDSPADKTEKETPAAGEDTGKPGATAVPAEVDPFGEFDEFDTPEQPEVFDPLSGYNRVMTRINDKLYYWVLKPVAKGYGIVVPRFVRRGIDNFFENMGFPVRFVNNVLQLKVHGAGVETARFLANSTIGIAGLWDPAMQLMEIPPRDEDFGQTLGRYGIGGGFHIVLPVFGPSNVRDTVGRVADGFLNPAAYLQDSDAALAVSVGKTVNATSLRIGEYEALTAEAIDLYVLLRDGYEQYRNKKIKE